MEIIKKTGCALMKKLKILSLSLFAPLILTAQMTDILELYKNLPDEYFSIRVFGDITLFGHEYRTQYLFDEYFDREERIFKASYWSQEEYDPNDSLSEIQYNYFIKHDEEKEYVSFKYYYEGNHSSLDMFLINFENEKYLVIAEMYKPGLGVPKIIAINYYKIDKIMPSDKQEITLPDFNWKDYYNRRQLKRLNNEFIGSISNPTYFSIDYSKDTPYIIIYPDFNEFAWKFANNSIINPKYDMYPGEAYEYYWKESGFGKVDTNFYRELPFSEIMR